MISGPFLHQRILITAGPTREPMDPVRYLTNPSSGKMGLILAEVLKKAGAQVTVVCGPTTLQPTSGITFIPVVTARQMFNEVKKRLKSSDVFMATAAVCDWRFERIFGEKLQKRSWDQISMTLVKNPDILSYAGRLKQSRRKPLTLVGFALETRNVLSSARNKLREKNLDLIIGNSPDSFAGDHIKPWWIEPAKPPIQFLSMTKRNLSKKIANWLWIRLNPTANDGEPN